MFLDTEASGKPTKWESPSAADCQHWPFLVQVSWVIYSTDGKEVKRENLYIEEQDFKSTSAALKIHKVTDRFRQENGLPRKEAMNRLLLDLQDYDPLLVCHFLEFDLRLLKVELDRARLQYDLEQIPAFCTMLATKYLAGTVQVRHLHLDKLYAILFYTTLRNHHDALSDALATAECFLNYQKANILPMQPLWNRSMQGR